MALPDWEPVGVPDDDEFMASLSGPVWLAKVYWSAGMGMAVTPVPLTHEVGLSGVVEENRMSAHCERMSMLVLSFFNR